MVDTFLLVSRIKQKSSFSYLENNSRESWRDKSFFQPSGQGAGRVARFKSKVQSIEKQVTEWQGQIEKAFKKGSEKEKEFKELEKALKSVVNKIRRLKNYNS